MQLFDDNDNNKKNKGGKGGKQPLQKSFFSSIISVILIFLVIATLYSIFVENKKEIEEIPVSQLSADVLSGQVGKITVEGEKLVVEYKLPEGAAEDAEPVVKESKKEAEASLSETLVNYGVTPEILTWVEIEVKNPTGFGYWALNLAPFLIPILFLVIFFWFISRSVKGSGGMQSFSFGQ